MLPAAALARRLPNPPTASMPADVQAGACKGSYDAVVRVYESLLRWAPGCPACAAAAPVGCCSAALQGPLPLGPMHGALAWLIVASTNRPAPAAPTLYTHARSVRGGDEAGDALHAPALRLRLLRSLAAAITAAKVGPSRRWYGTLLALFWALPGRQSAHRGALGALCSALATVHPCRVLPWHRLNRAMSCLGIGSTAPCPGCPPQDKLLDRAPGAFGGYRGGRREAGLLAAACEAYAGGLSCVNDGPGGPRRAAPPAGSMGWRWCTGPGPRRMCAAHSATNNPPAALPAPPCSRGAAPAPSRGSRASGCAAAAAGRLPTSGLLTCKAGNCATLSHPTVQLVTRYCADCL